MNLWSFLFWFMVVALLFAMARYVLIGAVVVGCCVVPVYVYRKMKTDGWM